MARVYWAKQDVNDDERSLVKTLNFAILYGIGIPGIARKFRKTPAEAGEIRNRYREAFPIMRAYNQGISNSVKADGYVKSSFGRKRHLEAQWAYKGVNALVQGSCSDVMKLCMIDLHKLMSTMKSRILLTIHDELCIEIHKTELELVPEIIKIMTNFPQFKIPLKVDVK